MGQPLRIFRKNSDWFIAVVIPNLGELARLDGASAEGAQEVQEGQP
jgi:hypothetical protein